MCEFCTLHGEGKIWYLAAQNYAQEVLRDTARHDFMWSLFRRLERTAAWSLSALDAIGAVPFVPGVVSAAATASAKRHHFGQVVPLEDAERILDLTDSIVRLPCVCRTLTTGRKDARYCFGLGAGAKRLMGCVPDDGGRTETLTPDEARAALRGLDSKGLVHSVWTFHTPFIGGLCNCDQDCLAYRTQVSASLSQVFFPAEYVARIEPELCRGCRQCAALCAFGSVRFSASSGKCSVDPHLCYGCGVCRVACKSGAVTLERRTRPFAWRRRPAPWQRFRPTIKPCRAPQHCGACLQACPAKALILQPQGSRHDVMPDRPRNQAADRQCGVSGRWLVRAMLPSRCTLCGDCARVCPEQAIAMP